MTPDQYIESLPEERQAPVAAIRDAVKRNLPKGFQECMTYGMIGWVVPLSTYPAGYHCDPKLPLGYMSLGSQKNYVSLYCMCLYGNDKQMQWFRDEWLKHTKYKLDMGKACIRFKKLDDLPLQLIGQLAASITPKQWIDIYESSLAEAGRARNS